LGNSHSETFSRHDMLKSPTQADLRQAVETVPVPRVGGGQRDLPVAIRATLVNFVLTNADVEALVKQGPSGTFASAYSSIAHSENAPFQKAAALEETTAALEIIRDQDRSDPNFTDLAVFFTGTLRTKKGSPSKRGVVLTAAGKLRVLASGPRPINLVYCAAISDYLTNLLEAKAKHKKDHAGYVMENQQLRDKSKKRHLEMRAQLETEADDEGQRKKIPLILCLADKTLYGCMRPSGCKSMGECVLLGRGEENSQANRSKVSKKTIAAFGTHLFHAGQELARHYLHATAMLNPELDMPTCAKSVAENLDLRIKDPMTGKPYGDEVQAKALFNQSDALKAWSANPRLVAN